MELTQFHQGEERKKLTGEELALDRDLPEDERGVLDTAIPVITLSHFPLISRAFTSPNSTRSSPLSSSPPTLFSNSLHL
ncbi:hypothetical protein Q5P01_002407 [Channa striata]|uniref:Uncharacterized protein n=1 Tax=Channa striata TaxID=64152 RepID=A0AA88NRB1_CHASR|nr:hypothetical protein Q5P01_002407 [Channa striata]